jgi:hypothetical protein
MKLSKDCVKLPEYIGDRIVILHSLHPRKWLWFYWLTPAWMGSGKRYAISSSDTILFFKTAVFYKVYAWGTIS